ncbi:MAG: hypothetical protein COY75_04975 [Nitrospirae bacterium CG_4_10_14_0_8_um_filter_41_23]|nr:MAG: hypothetical protein COY75_04975 [Nitrospirae bacterium CG_4_10_14_0_8_um_filter_41_23]
MLIGRGNDQNLLGGFLFADLLFLGKEGNQFIRETLAGGDVFGNQDGDGFNLAVFGGLVFNMIVVNLLKLLVLTP